MNIYLPPKMVQQAQHRWTCREGNRDRIIRLRLRWLGVDLEEFDNVELYQAMAEDVLPYLDVSAEAVIVDPSRASLEKRVIEVILDWSPRRPVYVSCDPSMLDRDADISLQVVTGRFKTRHLFPQACYIESVSPFEKG